MTRVGDIAALGKPRIALVAAGAAAVGYALGSPGDPRAAGLVAVAAGTLLAAAGTSALNMLAERREDGRMERTRSRPLPSGRLGVGTTLALATLWLSAGLALLLLAGGVLAATLLAAAAGVYLLGYTPLKGRSALCVAVGALSGASPPLIGWAAARGDLEGGAWVLFAVLFLWQFPHVAALAARHADDYSRVGWRMHPFGVE
ncbi:MAG: UbiA family prenyltransferase, partial [Planctomycetales bacterium]|nr:UbiA family prenyltransferase [Planctomycetales bacterium]